MSDPLVPARVDRAALERILQRAAELQASEHDVGEGLTSRQCLDKVLEQRCGRVVDGDLLLAKPAGERANALLLD